MVIGVLFVLSCSCIVYTSCEQALSVACGGFVIVCCERVLTRSKRKKYPRFGGRRRGGGYVQYVVKFTVTVSYVSHVFGWVVRAHITRTPRGATWWSRLFCVIFSATAALCFSLPSSRFGRLGCFGHSSFTEPRFLCLACFLATPLRFRVDTQPRATRCLASAWRLRSHVN